jgi:Zn-dependent metalloprotease
MFKRILSIVLLGFIIFKADAQSFVSQVIRGEHGISKQFASIPDNQTFKFNSAQFKGLLSLNDNADLILKQTEQDKLGYIHFRYYQTYRGVPVENSMFIIHARNGVLKSLGGSIVTDFDPLMDERAASKISNVQAIAVAVKHVNAKVYAWQDADMQQRIKIQTNNPNASYLPKASLVWYSPTDDVSPRELRLCYKVDVYARQPLSRAYYFVDAITGKVIGKKDEIFYSDATGTAATAYSGNQTIHSDLNGGSYRLRDYTKGQGIITLHGESGQRGNDYSSNSSNWALSGLDQAALDAHYGVSQTYAYYFANFSRNSYDNAGTALYSYVNDPTYTDNAFWDGSAMNFNKRSNSASNPGGVTGIDVTGHELTHGVTQESSGLNYKNESGAINESMSDIFGKAVQFWSKPTDINWQISNDMNWIIRDMANPNAENQPDTYKGQKWATGILAYLDNGGVHTNSGVGNFMFYLLVTGGSGTNDIGSNYSVTGIGLTEAEEILYRTNTVYLLPTSKYADWRVACINAATDLFGAGSNEVIQVENAWYAVGVGTAGGGACTTPTGLASSSITSSTATLSWAAVSGAASYNLQYKTSAASTWITIPGITATSYNLTGLTASTTYNYQVQTVCSGSSTSSYSSPVSFTTLASTGPVYCTTKGSTSREYIKNVTIGSINNTSGNNNGYVDYTALSVTLSNDPAGNNITLTPGFNGSARREYWTIFIDFNNDGIFTTNEKAAAGNGTGSITLNFDGGGFPDPDLPPVTSTRMRIIMHYGTSRTNTCGNFSYGEVEDYTVNFPQNLPGVASFAEAKTILSNSILVTPNPSKGNNVKLQLQLAQTKPVTLRIADLSGRVLHIDGNLNFSVGKNIYSLNGFNLKSGTYIIIAEQDNKIVARTKFIVAE